MNGEKWFFSWKKWPSLGTCKKLRTPRLVFNKKYSNLLIEPIVTMCALQIPKDTHFFHEKNWLFSFKRLFFSEKVSVLRSLQSKQRQNRLNSDIYVLLIENDSWNHFCYDRDLSTITFLMKVLPLLGLWRSPSRTRIGPLGVTYNILINKNLFS